MAEDYVALNFLEQIVEEDITNGFPKDDLRFRFPPEPNGYLHIGHCKAICISFGLGEKYNAPVNLRFDDTNPLKEEDEYVRSIIEDVKWLGFDWQERLFYASDYFEQMFEFAIQLIEQGNAFVCDQTADQITTRVPMILKWPGADDLNGRKYEAMHYQIDVSATIVELLGVRVPKEWDGESFAESLNDGKDQGRDYLVLSQGAWTCQRAVRWDDYILIQTLHDGYHLYDDIMLFDLVKDPHEINNLAGQKENVVEEGLSKLNDWYQKMMADPARGKDPLLNVIEEGGPYHVRGQLKEYLSRLRETDRSEPADQLAAKYSSELQV